MLVLKTEKVLQHLFKSSLAHIRRGIAVDKHAEFAGLEDIRRQAVQRHSVCIYHDVFCPRIFQRNAQGFFDMRVQKRLSADDAYLAVAAVAKNKVQSRPEILKGHLCRGLIDKFVGKAIRTAEVAGFVDHNIGHSAFPLFRV
jgi:hypothetical protein